MLVKGDAGGKGLRQRGSNLLQYVQMVMVSFVSPNIWTAQTNQHITGENCVRNDGGEAVLSDNIKIKVWVVHYGRLLNVNGNVMNSPIVSDPSDIKAEMLRREGGVELSRQLVEAVFRRSEIPANWNKSFVLNLNNGKGEAPKHGNHGCRQLTEQFIKLLQWLLEYYIRKILYTDAIQLGCVPGEGTTDVIFIVCQLKKKYITTYKSFYLPFVNLEKSFSKEDPVVGLEVSLCPGMGCACHPEHLHQCTD